MVECQLPKLKVASSSLVTRSTTSQPSIPTVADWRQTCVPTISMFYGILIRMFFYDTDRHNLPHIHAEYQGQVAVYSIPDGEVLAGEIPKKKHKLVVAWI